MATPNTESSYIEPATPTQGIVADPSAVPIPDDDSVNGQDAAATNHWASTASFIFAGIIALGFLIIVIGEYVTSSIAVVLTGTTIISLGGVAWGLAALILMYKLVKQRFTSDAKAHT